MSRLIAAVARATSLARRRESTARPELRLRRRPQRPVRVGRLAERLVGERLQPCPCAAHCAWIADVGHSTSAGAPSRRAISSPITVFPLPGGATTYVWRRPAARSASKAASASSW